MKNRLLLLIIIVLLPISIFINCNNDENGNDEAIELEKEKQNIIVNLYRNNQLLTLDFNEYLIGVVGQEMPASFNIEAIKAQAVAARTFALNNLENNVIVINDSAQHYIDTEEMNKKWVDNYEEYYNKIKKAVFDTNNKVIKYNNKLIKSYYYAISNGKSEDSIAVFNEELPYLKVVDSTFDKDVNNFEVKKTITYEDFCLSLNISPCEIKIDDEIRDESNRVLKLSINKKEYLGVDLRKLLNLRSTDFKIDLLENNIEIITKGYGHGVGMSQYGANYLANNGYKYNDILKYYYKDVEITNF